MPYAYFGLIVSEEPLKTEIGNGKTVLTFKTNDDRDVPFFIKEVGPNNLETLAGRLTAMVRELVREAKERFRG